jgi:hypothetical protein
MDNKQHETEIQKKLSEEIMSEAEDYYALAKEYREKKWNDDEEYVHIK